MTEQISTRLVDKVRHRDASDGEYERFVGLCTPCIRYAAKRKGIAREDFEEFYQEMLCDLLEKGLEKWQPQEKKGSFGPWLIQRALWRAGKYQRKNLSRREREEQQQSRLELIQNTASSGQMSLFLRGVLESVPVEIRDDFDAVEECLTREALPHLLVDAERTAAEKFGKDVIEQVKREHEETWSDFLLFDICDLDGKTGAHLVGKKLFAFQKGVTRVREKIKLLWSHS